VIAWPLVRLSDLAAATPNSLATGPFGSAVSARHFRDVGVPLIRGSNLSIDVGKRLLDADITFLSEEKAREFRRSQAVRGDLVFTCWGTIGQIGLIDQRARFDRYIVSNKQMKLTPDPSKVDSHYLYYALSSPDAVAAVQAIAIGSSVPGFNLGQLREIKVPLPPLAVQRAVVAVLGALDDKIIVNHRKATLLGSYVRTKYDEGATAAQRTVRLGSLVEQGLGGVWGESAPTSGEAIPTRCLRGVDLAMLANGELPSPPVRWLSPKPFAKRAWREGEIWVEGSGSFCGRSLLVGPQLDLIFDELCVTAIL
jgi:type I restriction enzyme, S subunit